MKHCKRCNLPQVDYPLFEDENGYPIEKEQLKQKMKNKDFTGFKPLNLFKMNIEHIALIVIVLIMAWSYAHDTKQCREIVENPCNLTKAMAYGGSCKLDTVKIMEANARYEVNDSFKIVVPVTTQNGN